MNTKSSGLANSLIFTSRDAAGWCA